MMKAIGKAQVYLAVAVALGSIAAFGPAHSQGGDPIGELVKTSTFSRAERIN